MQKKPNGLVYIRTDSHGLFCELYGIKYDRIGIRYNEQLKLYWNIPTEESPYLGPWSEFHLIGAKLYFSRVDNDQKLAEMWSMLENWSMLISTEERPFANQWRSSRAAGSLVVSRVLKVLNPALDDGEINVNLKLADVPIQEDRNQTLSPILCADLLNAVSRNPGHILRLKDDRTKAALTALHLECEQILTAFHTPKPIGILPGEVLDAVAKLTHKVASAAGVASYGDGDSQPTTDKLFLVERDRSIRNQVESFRRTIDVVLADIPYLDIEKLIKAANPIFDLFGIKKIRYSSTVPYSYLIGISEANTKGQPESRSLKISGDDGSQKILIPLSGEGLDHLSTDQLAALLKTLGSLDTDTEQFATIRAEASRLYYKSAQL